MTVKVEVEEEQEEVKGGRDGIEEEVECGEGRGVESLLYKKE